jgi:hypothetical protein
VTGIFIDWIPRMRTLLNVELKVIGVVLLIFNLNEDTSMV